MKRFLFETAKRSGLKTLGYCRAQQLQMSCLITQLSRVFATMLIVTLSFGAAKTDIGAKTKELLFAARDGDLEKVCLLISYADHAYRCYNTTPLMVAAKHGKLEIVKYLVEKCGQKLNFSNHQEATPLHWACHGGHEAVARYLVQKKARVESHNKKSETPLHLACEMGHCAIAKLLIDAGADPNKPTDDGKSCLFWASINGHNDIVKLLLKLGCNVNDARHNNWTPLHSAAFKNHVPVVRTLVNAGAWLDAAGPEGKTPLTNAAEAGNREVVHILLNAGAEIDKATENGQTALEIAASYGRTNVVKALLDAGARYDIFKNGETLLHKAAESGNTQLVEFVLSLGFDINAQDSTNNTPLIAALRCDEVETAEFLIRHDAQIDIRKLLNEDFFCKHSLLLLMHRLTDFLKSHSEITEIFEQLMRKFVTTFPYIPSQFHDMDIDRAQTCWLLFPKLCTERMQKLATRWFKRQAQIYQELVTAGAVADVAGLICHTFLGFPKTLITELYQAAVIGNCEKLLVLLQYKDKIPEVYGVTLLHIAAENNQLELAKLLVRHNHGINVRAERAQKAYSPLYIAAQNGHTDIVHFLINHGANIDQETSTGATPLFIASQKGHANSVVMLIAAGADVNRATHDGITPLFIAAQLGHENIVSDLIKAGAHVDTPLANGVTAIYVATYHGHTGIVKLLKEAGEDVNKRWPGNVTLLHIAAQQGHSVTVQYVISAGANVNARDANNESPLTYGLKNKHVSVAKVLTSAGCRVRVEDKIIARKQGCYEDIVDSCKELVRAYPEFRAYYRNLFEEAL